MSSKSSVIIRVSREVLYVGKYCLTQGGFYFFFMAKSMREVEKLDSACPVLPRLSVSSSSCYLGAVVEELKGSSASCGYLMMPLKQQWHYFLWNYIIHSPATTSLGCGSHLFRWSQSIVWQLPQRFFISRTWIKRLNLWWVLDFEFM